MLQTNTLIVIFVDFLFAFERQIEKVGSFYQRRRETIERRLTLIENALKDDKVSIFGEDFMGHRLFLSAKTDPIGPSATVPSTLAIEVRGGQENGGHGLCRASTVSTESRRTSGDYALQPAATPSNSSNSTAEDPFFVVDRETILLEHVEECKLWLKKLGQYCELNWEGFRKILKKYDKRRNPENKLQESYFQRRVVKETLFGQFRVVLADCNKRLEACSVELVTLLTGNSSKEVNTLKEIERIWNDIYSLQVRAVIENDDADSLADITNRIKLDVLLEPVSSTEARTCSPAGNSLQVPMDNEAQRPPSPGLLSEKALQLLERNHALLLKHLLDGICAYQSVKCMTLLLDSGIRVPMAEKRFARSLLGKVLSFVPPVVQCIPSSDTTGERAAELLKLLKDNGATILFRDYRGRTLLHTAVLCGHLACLEAIWDEGLASLVNSCDIEGCSPLFYAIQTGNPSVTQFILERLQEHNVLPVMTEGEPMDPLMLACKVGQERIISAILEQPWANINVRDLEGDSCLHQCVKRDYHRCAELLLLHGADPEILNRSRSWSPLAEAAAMGCEQSIRVLLNHGAHKNSRDKDGWTPFEHAIYRGHLHLADFLRIDSVAQGLEELSAISTAEESLGAPPTAATITEEMKEYGHSYLGRKSCLRLQIGHLHGLRSSKPAVEILDRPITSHLNLTLKVSSTNSMFSEPVYLNLPIKGQPDVINFVLGSDDAQIYKNDDEIHFEILNTDSLESNTEDIVAKGIMLLREILDVETGRPLYTAMAQRVIPVVNKISLQTMALISCEILIAMPFAHPSLVETMSRGTFYWKSLTSKVIGHRGLGAHTHLSHPTISENSVLSFVMAASLGAEYVEFDVQLTKDRVPVLYHNFVVGETGFHVGLPDITLKQFMNLKKRVTGKTGDHEGTIPKGPGTSTDDASGFQRRNYISRGDFKCLEFPPNNSPGLETRRIETSFATLEGALKEVPQNVGFNVEIKYPMEDEMVLYELRYKFEINEYCDAILEVVYTNARQRSIFFSSFHPDVCLLLSLKQPKYPVFFLTESGKTIHPLEPRASSLRQAVRFAKAANLLGIVAHSDPLVAAPNLIAAIKSRGLLLLTYGEKNNELKAARLQKKYGVDGVIVDSVARIYKGFQEIPLPL